MVPNDRTWLIKRIASDTSGRFVTWALVIILSTSGCTTLTAEIDPSGIPAPAVEPIPAIVVVDSPRWDFRWTAEWSGTETGLADCLTSELADRQNQYDLISANTFKQAAFPNLSADLAPDSPKYVKLALTHPDVQKRLQALRIKYLIYIAGTTEVTHDWGDVACYFGYGFGGCGGLIVADQTSDLSAMIMDIDASGSITNVEATNQGKNWLVVLGVLPIWNEAPTRQAACQDLARKVIEDL